jgi:hypothetical protein
MSIIKRIPTLFLIYILIAAGCKKDDFISYNKPFTVANTGGAPTTSGGKAADSVITDSDAFIHHIQYKAGAQQVVTSISGDTLVLKYHENVSIYLPARGYVLSYSVHLVDDFSQSVLKNFDFIIIDAAGHVNFNWADDNLSNIPQKTVKDSTINNTDMTVITAHRLFTFSKAYADHATAVNARDSIMKIKTDKINYSAYVLFTKTYPVTVTSALIIYTE